MWPCVHILPATSLKMSEDDPTIGEVEEAEIERRVALRMKEMEDKKQREREERAKSKSNQLRR